MTCVGCDDHVRKALYDQEGVIEASASYEKRTARVKLDKLKTDVEKL